MAEQIIFFQGFVTCFYEKGEYYLPPLPPPLEAPLLIPPPLLPIPPPLLRLGALMDGELLLLGDDIEEPLDGDVVLDGDILLFMLLLVFPLL